MTLRSAGARAAALAFAAFLPIGIATMNRSIGYMDRGELAGVASTWGIAHPTGYPTLMLIAGALVHLVPLRPVLVLNVFAVVLVALGTACLTLLMDQVLARLRPALDSRPRAMLALASALVTSFSVTWWEQANGFEVYPLHCVLMPLVVWLALRWIEAAASPDGLRSRRARARGGAFAFVTGLAFTNHLTIGLLAPGLIALACAELGTRGLARRLPGLALPFLAGLLPYAWLPVRAAMNPVLNWGDPDTWGTFLRHVSGHAYRSTLTFTGVTSLAQQARFTASYLPWDYLWVGLALVAAGAVWMARHDRRLLLFVALTVVVGVGFAVNYAVGDLIPYFLTATFALGLFLAAGLLFVQEHWGTRPALTMGAALIALNLIGHWHDCDERGNGVPEAFFRDLFTPLPPRALLFSTIWAQAESPAWYFQNVERVRDDVVLVNPDMVRARWYVEGLERRAPDLIARVPRQYARYLADLRNAEAGRPYDGRVVDAARQEFMTALALAAMRDRQVFSTDRSPELPAGTDRTLVQVASYFRDLPRILETLEARAAAPGRENEVARR